MEMQTRREALIEFVRTKRTYHQGQEIVNWQDVYFD